MIVFALFENTRDVINEEKRNLIGVFTSTKAMKDFVRKNYSFNEKYVNSNDMFSRDNFYGFRTSNDDSLDVDVILTNSYAKDCKSYDYFHFLRLPQKDEEKPVLIEGVDTPYWLL